MKLGSRLSSVASFVPKDAKLLDVGCDHAKLDIYLTEKNLVSKAVATDIKEGPLKEAKKNIKRHKLTNDIETRLGAGLDTYTKDLDTVVVSGLGGKSMMGIFKYSKKKLKTIKTIIISPNNYQSDIKKCLTHLGYYISDETLVKDGKYIYQVIKLEKGYKFYTKKDMFFGPILLTKKDNMFKEYYKRELKSREILLDILPKNYRLKKYQTKQEIKMIKKELDF